MLKLSKYKSVKTMVQSYEKSAVPKFHKPLHTHFPLVSFKLYKPTKCRCTIRT